MYELNMIFEAFWNDIYLITSRTWQPKQSIVHAWVNAFLSWMKCTRMKNRRKLKMKSRRYLKIEMVLFLLMQLKKIKETAPHCGHNGCGC